jgi:hypothetical protein
LELLVKNVRFFYCISIEYTIFFQWAYARVVLSNAFEVAKKLFWFIILNLLNNLNPHKARGPDNINSRVMKDLKDQVAPILTKIYTKSIETGTIPKDWKRANVAPAFKMGERYKAENYRPISLTCICCKLMEHIIISNIMKHLDSNTILYDLQHGLSTDFLVQLNMSS